MMVPTLKHAFDGIPSKKKILVMENADHIVFEEMDFQNGGEQSDHVWLYINRVKVACIDMRSVSGLTVYPWPYSNEDDEPYFPKVN